MMAESGSGPLKGRLVVGLEHSVAGPLCTRILGDLGAEVIKIERPGRGDFSRHWDNHLPSESAQFWWLNQGKQGLALNLRSKAGRKAFFLLLEKADVLVQNLSPRAATRLGLDVPSFNRDFRRLIHCQISGFGAAGSYSHRKAYDMLVQAEAGIMSLTGTQDQPSRVGVSVCDVSTGIYAALLILAALIEREESGSGRTIDVSMLDVSLEFVSPMLMSYLNAGVLYPRIPNRHHAIAPYGIFQCGDGSHILLAIEQDSEWERFCKEILQDPMLAMDERFSTNVRRVINRGLVDDLVSAAFSTLTRADVINVLEEHSLAYAPLNDMSALAQHPSLLEREIIQEVSLDDGQSATTLSTLPLRTFNGSNNQIKKGRPPHVGEDTQNILESLPLTESEIEEILEPSSATDLPE